MEIPLYITVIFVILVGVLLSLAIGGAARLGTRQDIPRKVAAGLLAWLGVTAFLAQSGFFADFSTLPPRMALAVVPALMALCLLALTPATRNFITSAAPAWLIYFQVFRVVMEIILWLLFRAQLIPVQMTFEGRNFDIMAGATAPLIAYLCFSKRLISPKWAIVWNLAAAALLLNIVVTAILSMPVPFRVFFNEPANRVVAYFPFIWLPAFVVPCAMFGHLFSLIQLSRAKRVTK